MQKHIGPSRYDCTHNVSELGVHTHLSQLWQMWDLSGQQKFRDMWPAYLAACSAVVLVVDCADVDRLAVVQEAARTAHSSAPAHAPILVLANKRSQVHIAQDARSSPATAAPAPRLLSKEEVERVALASSIAAAGRSVRVVLANALSGDGMEAAAAWLEERLAHQQGAD